MAENSSGTSLSWNQPSLPLPQYSPSQNGVGELVGYLGGYCEKCGGIIVNPVYLSCGAWFTITHFPGWPPDTKVEPHQCLN